MQCCSLTAPPRDGGEPDSEHVSSGQRAFMPPQTSPQCDVGVHNSVSRRTQFKLIEHPHDMPKGHPDPPCVSRRKPDEGFIEIIYCIPAVRCRFVAIEPFKNMVVGCFGQAYPYSCATEKLVEAEARICRHCWSNQIREHDCAGRTNPISHIFSLGNRRLISHLTKSDS